MTIYFLEYVFIYFFFFFLFFFFCFFFFFFGGGGVACVLSLLGKSPYYGEVNIADEELNVLPYTQHSWPITCSEIHSAIPTVTNNNSLNGHFRGSVTLTPVTERITVGLSLPALTSWICRNRTLHLLNNSKYLNKRNYCQID